MPVRPGIVDRVALRANLAPAAITDLYGAGALHAAVTALDLDLFEELEEPRTVGELARDLDCDERGVRALAELLAETGYLGRDGRLYYTTNLTRKWLTDANDTNLGPWLRFWVDVVLPYWREHVELAVRTGDPGETIYDWLGDDEGGWETTQEGFRAAATLLVDPVSDTLGDVAGKRVLDLGGGHGAYAVELAERGAEVTLFDREAALGVAEESVAAAGVEDRVALRGGDYQTDEYDEDYLGGEDEAASATNLGGDDESASATDFDLVLLFNVLHAHDAEECEQLLERATESLAPDGRLVILDQFEGDGPTGLADLGVAFVDLAYLVTLGGRTHDVDDVRRWIAFAGCRVTRSETFRRAPGVRLLVAENRES
ncbi:methyltransferase domain-containing protein [Halorarum halophilum]|uniref:Methyltransferase domain-containing protein n=1 Tax=Halorarum halophilum TaxID=2743090 RepID=A0A7D5H0B7_9EURY|nr:class I SAM-dependent methyltransferase [Halobaculum halophilum]QLG27933.1 methyltransferase domain-containing protein [Halobaculum halophilum]